MTRQNAILPFESILIYGMGMMGASLSWAIRKHPAFQGNITGVVRSQKSGDYIREKKLADEALVVPDMQALSEMDLDRFDLVILGLPVETTVKVFASLPKTTALITDMSSTRRDVHEAAAKRPDLRFVGSHPMCGSEDSGPQAFVEYLYRDRLCIITPPNMEKGQDPKVFAQNQDIINIRNFWQSLDMFTHLLDPVSHDEMLAYLSHGPHVISSILTLWARKNSAVQNSLELSPMPVTGGGFKDMSRISGSNPEMWTDIMETNRDNLIDSLENFKVELDDAINGLKNNSRDDWLDWFQKARKARNVLCGYEEDR